jgi:ribonuclease T1
VFSSGLAERGASTSRVPRQAFRKWGLAAVAATTAVAAGLLTSTGTLARSPETPSALPVVALATLPEQAQQTYRLVLSGGPFPYRKDGTVFGNRERLLPSKARGYYREYTVPTPGSSDRGARRIVCGGQQPSEPDACFYTADHYASFRLIAR